MPIGKLDNATTIDSRPLTETPADKGIVARSESGPVVTGDVTEASTARAGGRIVTAEAGNPLLLGLEGRTTKLVSDLAQRHGVVTNEVARLLGAGRKDLSVHKLEDHERRRLGQKRLSPRESRALYRDVASTALYMRRQYMGARNFGMARVALAMEKLARRSGERLSILEAQTLLQSMARLPKAGVVHAASVGSASALLDAPGTAMITEFYLAFEHDMLRMRGPDFEPSGFRIYFSTQPPTGDDEADRAAAAKVVEVGSNEERLLHDPEPNTYDIHVAEVNSELDPNTEYYIWATAYNAHQESGNSEEITATLPAAQRGDLNKDGQIDPLDIDIMLGILLDGKLPRVLADMNRDGDNTQADLDLLVDAINGG